MYSILYNDPKINGELSNNELESAEVDYFECSRENSENLLQDSWSRKVEFSLNSIASYDPRLYGKTKNAEPKYVFSNVDKQWHQIEEMQFDSLIEEPPDELPARQAVLWSMGSRGVDMRPHIFDKITNEYLLVDSGAQISACPPDPGDKIDPSMTLRAANGSKMACYGVKKLEVRINRKTYETNHNRLIAMT